MMTCGRARLTVLKPRIWANSQGKSDIGPRADTRDRTSDPAPIWQKSQNKSDFARLTDFFPKPNTSRAGRGRQGPNSEPRFYMAKIQGKSDLFFHSLFPPEIIATLF